jgi:hypothetical protein
MEALPLRTGRTNCVTNMQLRTREYDFKKFYFKRRGHDVYMPPKMREMLQSSDIPSGFEGFIRWRTDKNSPIGGTYDLVPVYWNPQRRLWDVRYSYGKSPVNRKLQEALPKAQNFHFSGIFKCSEDVKNLNLKAMYDEAMCKILLDKTQATNLGIFLNDSAILHQYSRMSGKDLEDWVQRVLSFSNTTTSNPESLYPYPLLFSEQIKQFRLQQGIEKKQRRQKGSSFANSAHLERRALSDVQKCVDYLVMKTEDPTREHQWELDRVGA